MIKSMTGFGKGEALGKYGRFKVEIRTVNHRYFDVSFRIPIGINQLEDRIKNYIHRYIKRGKVNLFLSHSSRVEGDSPIKLDKDKIKKYYNILKKIKDITGLKGEITLSHILSFPDIFTYEEADYDQSLIWPILERALRNALLECNKMRQREGCAIYNDLTKRITKISGSVDKLASLAPRVVTEYKAKLDSKIKDILRSSDIVDRARLETELAIFAKQSDVTEEIVRARSHLTALRNGIRSANEVGRRLDFILQELHREINTLASKTSNVKISQLAVDIKSELEKLREQVQNVE